MKKTKKTSIKISEAGSRAKLCTPKHSYVVISINNKQIYLASEHYKKSSKTQLFYQQQDILDNIDLSEIPHGGEKDKPKLTMPLFLEAAGRIDACLEHHNKVLVNCTHGRSRSGSVIALYLIEYCGLRAEEAIEVVTRALEKRGYKGGIDIKGSCYGSYGDWIRDHEKNNKENLEPSNQRPRRSNRLKDETNRFADRFFRIKAPNLELNSLEAKAFSL